MIQAVANENAIFYFSCRSPFDIEIAPCQGQHAPRLEISVTTSSIMGTHNMTFFTVSETIKHSWI